MGSRRGPSEHGDILRHEPVKVKHRCRCCLRANKRRYESGREPDDGPGVWISNGRLEKLEERLEANLRPAGERRDAN